MSKKKSKTQRNKTGSRSNTKKPWAWLVVLEVLVLIGLVALLIVMRPDHSQPDIQPSFAATGTSEISTLAPTEEEKEAVQLEQMEEVKIGLGNGLVITDIGSYTGIYMEDGTDDAVSRVLMIVLTNNSEKALQYAEITLTGETMLAQFSASTIPAGESVVLLEKNRMAYDGGESFTGASSQHAVFFEEALELHENKLEISSFDGVLNVANISDADVAEDVVIYYKNSSADMLYGGITYRVTISGGIKAGEVKQLIANHFTSAGSRIMFVTCG